MGFKMSYTAPFELLFLSDVCAELQGKVSSIGRVSNARRGRRQKKHEYVFLVFESVATTRKTNPNCLNFSVCFERRSTVTSHKYLVIVSNDVWRVWFHLQTASVNIVYAEKQKKMLAPSGDPSQISSKEQTKGIQLCKPSVSRARFMDVTTTQMICVLRVFNFPSAKRLEIVHIFKILKSDPRLENFSSIIEYILSVSRILSLAEMQAMPCYPTVDE